MTIDETQGADSRNNLQLENNETEKTKITKHSLMKSDVSLPGKKKDREFLNNFLLQGPLNACHFLKKNPITQEFFMLFFMLFCITFTSLSIYEVFYLQLRILFFLQCNFNAPVRNLTIDFYISIKTLLIKLLQGATIFERFVVNGSST